MKRQLIGEEIDDIEANLFAIELLIPWDWICKDIDRLGGIDVESDPNIQVLAKRYQVSEQLMTFRIASLID